MDFILKPLITVIMPVYNCEKYILEAVESILQQTYTNFELILIDDCSTDATLQICKSFQDDRIVIIEKERNSGYTNSLNYGLSIAKGKYIARMDGDDISLPMRFEKQVDFLEANEDVVVCGTQYNVINSLKTSKHPIYHDDIKVKLLDGCYVAHPTVMIRKSFLDTNNLTYNPEMEPAEDYDLWSRIVFLGKIANLNEILLLYRISDNQISAKRAIEQRESAFRVKFAMLKKLEDDLTLDFFTSKTKKITGDCFFSILNQSEKLIEKNKINDVFNETLFIEWIKNENKKLIFNFYYEGIFNFKTIILLFIKSPSFFKKIGFFRSMKMIFKIIRKRKHENILRN